MAVDHSSIFKNRPRRMWIFSFATDLAVPYNYSMSKIEVLVPTAVPRVEKRSLAPRLDQLAGARIGWLDNMKANAGALLYEIAQALQSNGLDFKIIVASKGATAAAPDSVITHLKTCDAVVLAIAD